MNRQHAPRNINSFWVLPVVESATPRQCLKALGYTAKPTISPNRSVCTLGTKICEAKMVGLSRSFSLAKRPSHIEMQRNMRRKTWLDTTAERAGQAPSKPVTVAASSAPLPSARLHCDLGVASRTARLRRRGSRVVCMGTPYLNVGETPDWNCNWNFPTAKFHVSISGVSGLKSLHSDQKSQISSPFLGSFLFLPLGCVLRGFFEGEVGFVGWIHGAGLTMWRRAHATSSARPAHTPFFATFLPAPVPGSVVKHMLGRARQPRHAIP